MKFNQSGECDNYQGIVTSDYVGICICGSHDIQSRSNPPMTYSSRANAAWPTDLHNVAELDFYFSIYLHTG